MASSPLWCQASAHLSLLGYQGSDGTPGAGKGVLTLVLEAGFEDPSLGALC